MTLLAKKLFYFVRHGQTDANAQGLTCGGDWDISLNEKGKEQARRLANKIATLSPSIEHLYVSPMLRTRQTAEKLNAKLKAPISIIEGLREWRVGDWEKRPWKEIPNPFYTTENPANGEAIEQFEVRIRQTLNEILNQKKGIALIVSHGAVAHRLFNYLGFEQVQIENCEIYKVEPARSKWTLNKV